MIDIPNYEIGKLAGRGGVAEVYLARHKLLDRTVAIKVISPAQADDLADKRFLKEAKVVAGLRHPNIVSIYDVGVYENKYYIIMEYLEGGDLKQNVQRSLSIPQTLKIIRQITSALAHAHDKGFVHRDIKSQNIMFRADGTAVLTDFGIVKDLTADTGYTLDGTSIGTPHYMSPEQAQGLEKIDWRTDLYSLGVTFYEMLTGAVPYNADSAIAVALKHIKEPVPQLPEQFATFQPIIDKLMAKKPGDRFQSAHDLLEALGAIDGEGVSMETVVLKHQAPRKINIANVFFGVVLGCIIGGAALWAQPYLSDIIGGHKTNQAEPPAAEDQSAAPVARETKKPFLDVIKRNFSTSIDAEKLTGLIVKKDYTAALNYISQLKNEMPATDNEMMKKADQFLSSAQYMNAGDIYNTILSVDPDNTSALLGLLYVAIEKQKSLTAQTDPTPAEYDALLGLLNKAIVNTDSQYFKHLKIESVESLYEIADHQMKKQHLDLARQWASIGLKNAGDHLRLKKLAYLIQARISYNQNRLTLPEQDNALNYFRLVLQLDPDDVDAKQGIADIIDKYQTLAWAAANKGNYGDALRLIKTARSIAPNNTELENAEWMITGDMYASQARFKAPANDNALYFYNKILENAPQNKAALLRIAKIDLLFPLHQILAADDFSKKIPVYRTLFANLDAADAQYGKSNMKDIREKIIEQVQSDVNNLKKQKQPIPAELMTLVSTHFPNENEIFNTQYEILLTKGDESTTPTEKADYYLKALEMSPSSAEVKEKILQVINNLDNRGDTSEAKTIINRAMALAPAYKPFQEMNETIGRIQDTKAALFTQLMKIKRAQSFSEKTALYKSLFSDLQSAARQFGEKKVQDMKKDVADQVKADIASLKNSRQAIDPEFMALIEKEFPDLNTYVVNAQYDIYIAKGDKSPSTKEKADNYINALKLSQTREEATSRIEMLAENLDKNGDNEAAVTVLRQAIMISPNDLIFRQLFDNIRHIIEIYATNAGCGKENMISQAPVSLETLNLCVQYKNLAPSSVVNVVVDQKGGQTMEVPVVLDGRSGSKPINIVAPIEGFTTGQYSITVTQNNKMLAETQIQFIPERR